MSAELCDQIATIRRTLRHISKDRIIFLDETHLRLHETPLNTIVLPGEKPILQSAATANFAPRFDMIAFCTGAETLLPMNYAPKERGKGITTAMLIQFIDDIWAQAVGALDRYPLYLVLDCASIHNEEKIFEALHDRGRGEIVKIIKMPAHSAKRLSPLDNAIFHDWKQLARRMQPLSLRNMKRVMSDAWEQVSAADLRAHYYSCGLYDDRSLYFDCPAPSIHKH